MVWENFMLRVTVAMVLGAIIGAERQLRQRMAGLRTNALVASGACLFVLVSAYTGDISSAGRISGQVVSGIGVLSGIGLLVEATVGTLVILCANILLREAAQRINRLNLVPDAVEQHYAITIVCHADDEVHVRTLLLHALGSTQFALQSLLSEDLEHRPNTLKVIAEVIAPSGNQSQLEQIVSRISLEKSVSSVRWTLTAEHEELS